MLHARVPHILSRADGSGVGGTRGAVLCGGCDRDDPDAQGLLAFFALHETVTDETLSSVTALIRDWAERVIQRLDIQREEIAREIDEYLNGDAPT